MALDLTTQFAEQVAVNQLVQNVVYASGAIIAPFVAYAGYEFLHKLKIDEHKLILLFIGAGTYGLLMVGVLHGGTPRGVYWHGCCDGTCFGIHSQTHNRSESV